MSTQRPFKVWSCDRKVRKSMVASNLQELKEKSGEKHGITVDDVTLVLEVDGTKVEDDEYLTCVDVDTVLLALKPGEKWTPIHKHGQDETDSVVKATFSPLTTSLHDLALTLRQDVTKLVLFTAQQLQTLVSASESELTQLLEYTVPETRVLQSTCQRHLDEKQEAADAIQLLSMLKKQTSLANDSAETLTGSADKTDGQEGPLKKQRTD